MIPVFQKPLNTWKHAASYLKKVCWVTAKLLQWRVRYWRTSIKDMVISHIGYPPSWRKVQYSIFIRFLKFCTALCSHRFKVCSYLKHPENFPFLTKYVNTCQSKFIKHLSQLGICCTLMYMDSVPSFNSWFLNTYLDYFICPLRISG